MKHVLVFTGHRADYGLLQPLLQALHSDDALNPTLLIAGEHLVNPTSFREAQGLRGFKQRVLLPLAQAQTLFKQPMAQRASAHEAAMSHFIETSKPCYDALLLLGDRYEAMAVGLAAFYAGLPVIQLAAGDWTQGGTPDDRLRFALSSLASGVVCFSATSTQRMRRLGLHDEAHILHSSSLSVDNALAIPKLTRETLAQTLGLPLATQRFVLFTQHPIAAEGEASLDYLNGSLEALLELVEQDVHVLATAPNQDSAYGPAMAERLKTAAQAHDHLHYVESLGAAAYLQAMQHAVAVVGNSSSGLYESPLFQVPCVNIGPRQAGREHAANVLHVPYGRAALSKALKTVLHDEAFRQRCVEVVSPFGHQAAAPEIVDWLKRIFP